jgi:hypothetical protein
VNTAWAHIFERERGAAATELSKYALAQNSTTEALHTSATAEAQFDLSLDAFNMFFTEIEKTEPLLTASWQRFLRSIASANSVDPTDVREGASLLSGPWDGLFIYRRGLGIGRMKADLRFLNDVIGGTGQDEVGSFSVLGGVDYAKRQCEFDKQYEGGHSVHYKAVLLCGALSGRWTIGEFEEGSFLFWPCSST